MKYHDPDGIGWLLVNIKNSLENIALRKSLGIGGNRLSKKEIFRGSYDVWMKILQWKMPTE